MSRVAVISFLLALLIGAESAVAASPVEPLDLFDIGAPSFTNFSTRDGVPATVTVATQVDSDGFVWLASPAGVYRYDGRHWAASADPGMDRSVDSLWRDTNGTLWAAFREDGLARYDGAHWHVENRASGLPSQQIRRFAETRDDAGHARLWALSWDIGLLEHRDGRWVADPGNAQLPSGALLSMAQTRRIGGRPREWVGSGSNGLWFREDGSAWQRYRADGFDPGQVEFLYATEHAGREELWISVFATGLWRLTDDGLRAWTRERGELPTNDIYDIGETPLPNGDRALWVSSRSGLVRIIGEHAQAFDRRHGLPADAVRGLSTWRSPNGDEVLWLATEAGVARTIVGANQWLTASLMGMHATGVFAVRVEADGRGGERLWVGSSDEGIGLFEQGRWRTFSQANGALPDSSVRLITEAPDEHGVPTLWVGLRYGHLLRARDGPVFEPVDTPCRKRTEEAVTALLATTRDGHQERWVGTRTSGLYRWRDGRWDATGPPGVVAPWRVGTLVEQHVGARGWLWATTNQGLARYDGDQWTLLGRDAGLPDLELIGANLIAAADGTPVLWIGTTSAGIVRLDVADPQHPRVLADALPPPPDSTAYSALQDHQGRIYVCTNNGVQQLTPQARGYASRVFTRRDGMVHDECNRNAQFVDAHDRYWTGTLGGLTVYDPQRAVQDTQPKALQLIGLRVDEHTVEGASLHVAPGAHEIAIDYALLSWQREGESRYRSQLLGYEDVPGEWTAQSSRTFNALAPGRYHLRIEGRDYAGNVSTPLDVPIEVEARWWQEAWARVAGAAALVLLGYAAVMLRVRMLKVQRRELEQRVAARTLELNEANTRLLELSYVDALTGLANRRRLLETLERDPARARQTALILVDVDHFKAYNDRHGHPAGDEALRAVARALRDGAPSEALVARYGGEEFACLLRDADATTGVALAERIRAAVAARDIAVPGTSQVRRVTISAGVASAMLASAADAHALLRDADIALYQAKRDGRDRVRSADDRVP